MTTDNKIHNINMSVRLQDNKFYTTNHKGIEKEFTPQGYFDKLKQKLPQGKRIFINIHTHILDLEGFCNCLEVST